VRRLFAVFLLCSTVALIAATPAPSPTRVPQALASFTPAPVSSGTGGPAVLVYPFDTPTDLDARYGSAVAQIYNEVFTDSGGLKVLNSPTNIKREDYAKFAKVQHADYYISGYIQPIGNGAAIVMQVVDVDTGIAFFSQTTQIQSVPDVGSQAITARTAILQHAGIETEQISTVRNTPTPSSTSGASVSISNVLGDIFKGKGKGGKTVAANATPTPVPKPSRGILLTNVTGTSSVADLNSASAALWRALGENYTVRPSNVAITNLAKQADSVCGTFRDNTVVGGTLLTTHTRGTHPHNAYSFTLTVAACYGATLFTDTENGDNLAKVIGAAVQAYVTDHPDNN
jgi:hypothetical protein